VLVEVLRDTATGLAPVSAEEATRMLLGLKGARLLHGFRGSAKVDIAALAAIVARVSEFLADQRGRIDELDINPLICAGDGIVAVDALIVRRG
jgi:acetate---CoA ligase (ADP-forming)